LATLRPTRSVQLRWFLSLYSIRPRKRFRCSRCREAGDWAGHRSSHGFTIGDWAITLCRSQHESTLLRVPGSSGAPRIGAALCRSSAGIPPCHGGSRPTSRCRSSAPQESAPQYECLSLVRSGTARSPFSPLHPLAEAMERGGQLGLEPDLEVLDVLALDGSRVVGVDSFDQELV
jgi:hypothetical protein